MKKIAFVVSSLTKSGPTNIVYDIIKNLDRTAYIPEIFVLRGKIENRSVVDLFNRLNIRIIFLNFSLLTMEIRTKHCSEILDNYLIDGFTVVHAHSYHAALIVNKSKIPVKKIVTFHNICIKDFISRKGIIMGRYMSARYLHAVKDFEEKVGITEAVSAFYRNKLKRNITTIFNGMDCSKFDLVTEEKRITARKSFGINNETVYVIIGAISQIKNVLYVVDTAKKLNDKSKLFYFVGTGPLLEKCKRRAKGYDNIRFVGYQMDIREYLNIADYSIAASTFEGFGLAALEVVISGIPLIYSDCSAYKELFFSCEYLKDYMFSLKEKDGLYKKIKNCPSSYKNAQSISDFYKLKYGSIRMAEEYSKLY